VLSWALALTAYTAWRAYQPIEFTGDARSIVRVTGEVALAIAAVIATGYWSSPFVFSLLTAIIIAGFAEGYGFALRTAVTAALAVALPLALVKGHHPAAGGRVTAEWSIELLLVALVAGYAQRIFSEVEGRHSLALARMSQLTEANDLLLSLHRLTQQLPASLDLGDTLAATAIRARELLEVYDVAVLLAPQGAGDWSVALSDGARLPSTLARTELPPPVRHALQAGAAVLAADLGSPEGPGLTNRTGSGIYLPLVARGSLVGLLVLEHPIVGHFQPGHLRVAEGLAEPAALAVDNARWFGRLRTVAAEQERIHIARDLHDRVGQSLAYLAFELDRITKRFDTGQPIRDELHQLRKSVRSVVSEVREALYDLRTDVSESRGLTGTLEEFLRRVHERSGIDVVFEHEAVERPPIPVERELFRIAQEAVANVERHSHAKTLTVTWTCDDKVAVLELRDDGVGIEPRTAARLDAYGIVGMRERADAIGAELVIESDPGGGTSVRCRCRRS